MDNYDTPQTAITTAARRIARETNDGYAEGYRLYFDAEGRLTHTQHGPGQVPGADTGVYVVVVTGERLTQRAAQDVIDAHAEAERLYGR